MRNHVRNFVEEDESFFVKLWVVWRRVFHKNDGPESYFAFANESSSTVKGPALNLFVQWRMGSADKPLVPETKSLVGALDASGLVALACPPIQAKPNRLRELSYDVKNIVRKNHFGHVIKDTV